MGERHLARLGALAAADERGQRGGMMRIAEGPVAHQPPARELARHRMDHRDLEGGGGIERRQQAGQALRQHRFARTRRADHQQIMPAGGRHLQRALGGFLALDIGEIEGMDGKILHLRTRPGEDLAALEVIDQRDDGGRRQHLDLAGPGRLAALGRGADQAAPGGRGRDGRGQHAGDGIDAPVQPELPQHRVMGQLLARQHAHLHQHPQRDGQIEMAALLQQIGGREIDGDAAGRQSEPDGDQRGTHPLPALADRLVGQADDGEAGQAGHAQLHLGIHLQAVDALEGDRLDPCHHELRIPSPGSARPS